MGRLARLFLGLLLALALRAGPAPALAADLSEAGQLLLVLSESWNATSGELRAYERKGSGWALVSGPLAVSLGRAGLAWGAGLHGATPPGAAEKREGDGRAPAGAFLLDGGFAYDPAEVGPARLPLLRADADLLCVDDVKSRHYNRLVRRSSTQTDWDSAEDMLRRDHQYRFGALVRHNADPVRPGGGSCIFLHIWRQPGAPTSGCTAMDQEQMLGLLRWLDADRRPVLAQLPMDEYLRLRAAWGLPHIPGR